VKNWGLLEVALTFFPLLVARKFDAETLHNVEFTQIRTGGSLSWFMEFVEFIGFIELTQATQATQIPRENNSL